MTTVKEFNRAGEDIESILLLKTSPVAVKMLEKEADIPAGAMRPKQDHNYHLAQCQAFTLSRRDRKTVAMLKEDHWCPGPLNAYGIMPAVEETGPAEGNTHDSFEYGKYIGVLTAPLNKASFIPDVVLVYSNTAQLRAMLLSLGGFAEVPDVNGRYFPPSCVHCVVTPMKRGGYWIVLPDPGEYQRALGDEGEMIFAMPAEKAITLAAGLNKYKDADFAYRKHSYAMLPDFPRPDFYKSMYTKWGLEDY